MDYMDHEETVSICRSGLQRFLCEWDQYSMSKQHSLVEYVARILLLKLIEFARKMHPLK